MMFSRSLVALAFLILGECVKDTEAKDVCFSISQQGEEESEELPVVQGPPGRRGFRGLPGPPGPDGLAGPTGRNGSAGPPGQMGIPGLHGINGSIGLPGIKGSAGLAGPVGSKGDAGPAGSKGIPGIPGLNGTTGLPGPKGDKGTHGSKGDSGQLGTKGLAGQKGRIGFVGRKGSAGAKGVRGPKGSVGSTGLQGPPGPKGGIGPTGFKGSYGAKGSSGLKGDVGPRGFKGNKGVSGECTCNENEISKLKEQISMLAESVAKLNSKHESMGVENLVTHCSIGMEDRRISDGFITASSIFGGGHEAYRGRLDNRRSFNHIGAWQAKNRRAGEWIQVDLGSSKRIAGVVTQGRPESQEQWAKSYKIAYGNTTDDMRMIQQYGDLIFQGNRDGNTKVANMFPKPVYSRYVRLIVQTWYQYITLRVEFLSC